MLAYFCASLGILLSALSTYLYFLFSVAQVASLRFASLLCPLLEMTRQAPRVNVAAIALGRNKKSIFLDLMINMD